MTKVVMAWHGGSNYAVPCPGEGEAFPSLKAAKDEFKNRAGYNRKYPCVYLVSPDEGGPSAWLWFGEESEYPDRILSFGPRGGVRCEYA